MPVEEATGDYYGANRPGDNLFAETLLAVDLYTGERKWHYQLVHHGIWDHDIPCAPILIDVTVDGRPVKAVAQPTKQAFLYVFDRVTGEPLWPIEERPVPQGDVPGEYYSLTQPFPTKPPAYERQGVTEDDLIDFTPALKREAARGCVLAQDGTAVHAAGRKQDRRTARFAVGAESGRRHELAGRLVRPANQRPVRRIAGLRREQGIGGAVSRAVGDGVHRRERRDRSTHDRRVRIRRRRRPLGVSGAAKPSRGNDPSRGPPRLALSVQGLPLLKPPYGSITAIDMTRGEILWRIAHGETPDDIRNHPLLKDLDIPRTGQAGSPGTLVTRTLLIAGETLFTTTSSGELGAMLRAYDKATGREVGAVYMPAPQTGSPMTYLHGEEQYIVIAISGPQHAGELLALKLPAP